MRKQNGFTLIELLVAIAIIGVLTAVLLANMVGIRERSSDAKIKNDVKQFKTALRLYYNDNQAYPEGVGIHCDNIPGVSDGVFESDSGNVYMKEVPTYDDTGCLYSRTGSGEGFRISINLKNQGDTDSVTSANRCGVTPTDGIYYECAD